MIAEPILNLVREFKRLPGVGEKTAMRMALHVLRAPAANAQALARALVEVKERIRPCRTCRQMTDREVCEICSSPKRDAAVVCVVEDQSSLMAIENTRGFNGLYHVLGGRLSPLDGVGPSDLSIDALAARMAEGAIREVIMATSPNVDGEATALFVKRALEPFNVKVTRIARGIPVGGDIEFADSLTLGRAMEGRVSY